MVADWQRARLPADAIPVAERLPVIHQHVLAWVSDEAVSIHHFPVVAWRTSEQRWWAGVPADYLDLGAKRWKVTHWLPIQAEQTAEAA